MGVLFAFLMVCFPLAAQMEHFSFGLTGGVPLNRSTATIPFGPDESRPYTFGVALEASLDDRISVLFNPLYRRTGARYGYVPNSLAILSDPTVTWLENTGQIRSNSFQFPVIGRYTFRRTARSWKPFAGGGFAFQTSWQTIQNRIVYFDNIANTTRTIDSKYNSRTPFDVGAVFSTGLVIRRGRFRYTPELRFTRWGRPDTGHSRSQFDALVSFRF